MCHGFGPSPFELREEIARQLLEEAETDEPLPDRLDEQFEAAADEETPAFANEERTTDVDLLDDD